MNWTSGCSKPCTSFCSPVVWVFCFLHLLLIVPSYNIIFFSTNSDLIELIQVNLNIFNYDAIKRSYCLAWFTRITKFMSWILDKMSSNTLLLLFQLKSSYRQKKLLLIMHRHKWLHTPDIVNSQLQMLSCHGKNPPTHAYCISWTFKHAFSIHETFFFFFKYHSFGSRKERICFQI